MAGILGIVGGLGFAAAIDVPEVETVAGFTPNLITQLRDRNDDVFGSFAFERRILLEEDEIPELLRNAVIAIEDSEFLSHGGVDAFAVARAQIANYRAGEIVSGAGTITMQLARMLFLTPEQTWSRKIEEAFLAVELEKNYSKDQILTLYLNLVNLGHGNYGMEAASQYFFGKSVDQLDLPQAATLAGIVQLPSRYSPYRRPELVQRRRDRVLRRMLAEQFIDQQQYDDALATPLEVIEQQPKDRLGPYFAEEVRKHLESTYGSDAVTSGGLQVWTTMDRAIQESAESAVRAGLTRLDRRKGWRGAIDHVDLEDEEARTLAAWQGLDGAPAERWIHGLVTAVDGARAEIEIAGQSYTLGPEGYRWTKKRSARSLLEPGDVAWFRLVTPEADPENPEAVVEPVLYLEQEPEMEAALVVLESATGAVRAMVGGWDYRRNKFNRVTQAKRQVGSAFKLFVFGAALEAGFTPADTLLDGPTAFLGGDNELSYVPRNYYRGYYGIITLRRALELSANITSVKLQDMVGVPSVIEFARRCGVESELPPYPSLALGVSEMTPLELAASYAAVANHGTWVEPYTIERVEMPDGRLREAHVPTTSTAMEPRIAYLLSHVLEGVVDRGTATAVKGLDLDLAGKTGTTDDYTDAWFVGYTPRYTILSWVGYDRKRSLGYNMTGAEAALPMWQEVVEDGLAEGWIQTDERFVPPAGVNLQSIEYFTGLLPGPGAERLIEEAFLQGTEPIREYEPKWAEIMELPWYQQRPFYLAKEGERLPLGFDDEISEELANRDD
ncbi:MAG: PBP1A family penicillin-binding protein [Acidobacteriota bacterium]